MFPAHGSRRHRMAAFVQTFAPSDSTRILDVGGTETNWGLVGYSGDVTLLNLTVPEATSELPPTIRYVQGDGTRLPYEDNSFDIAFSNSVIEHLHSRERQLQFARELSRVAPRLWVQTPARWFPIEPHFMAPFIHYVPSRFRRRLVRRFTPYGLIVRPTQQVVDQLLEEYRLMTYGEVAAAFPDCEVRRERFLGLTKAFVAVRGSQGHSN